MSYIDTIQQFLWIFPTCLSVITLIIMAKGRLYRELPVFTAYLACVTLYDIAGAGLRESHPGFYFYFYWIGDGFTALLGLCVIYEIFRIVLKPFSSVQRIGSLLFRASFFVLALIVITTFRARMSADVEPLIATILNLELSIRILEAGLFFFLFSFASSLGLTWKHHVFGVAAGLALFVATELAVVAMRSYYGRAADDLAYQVLKPAAFNCGVLIWAGYIWRGEPVTSPATRVPEQSRILEWNNALAEYLSQ
jgi:hypothetical protein